MIRRQAVAGGHQSTGLPGETPGALAAERAQNFASKNVTN